MACPVWTGNNIAGFMMEISIIVAVAENGVIGRGGELPWRLSADLRRFKQLTMGHSIVMGRRTYESIGRQLPGRRMIVISRQPDYRAEGVEMASSLEAAVELARRDVEGEVFIIGGAEVFQRALPLADRLYLTRVHANVEGDTYFPEVDMTSWKQVSSEDHPLDEKNEHPMSFEAYERV